MLALSACATPAPGSTAPAQLQATTPETFSLLGDDELTADMPHLAPGGDAKAYAAGFIHWIMTPGDMITRSTKLATGAPPDIADAGEFSRLVRELSKDGNLEAKLFNVIGSANDMSILSDSDHPLATFFLNVHKLHQGSLQEKIDALGWLRAEAATNMDAAFSLGGFLIDQGASQDYSGPSPRMLATPGEIREGTLLLKRVAAHTTLQSMIHIAELLAQTLNTPAGDPVALRQILELTVAATSTAPVDEARFVNGIAQELGDNGGGDATYQAVALRVALAELLESGRGGTVDVERAKALYLEGLKATQDTESLRALKRLGVDVSAYEEAETTRDDLPGEGGDALEDQ